ncbi:MAG: hypothetical protein UU77_C0009G0011 [candidate division WWE3 bacterium GW2011_GWC1_41_7]|uniref:PD-(D/E)XK endonuclease-like domain-containing protein n=1 Tax=candidate division WWE3 bacterium GW2011_GWC1_41_7 TaxID=1619119 RepID=A0A0G0X7J7_UNCKA|nr:MAG: hypothetical protein UU77_C0009G0011 [candidate division WWE3 bacterium GW2011_GWC1_41_7]
MASLKLSLTDLQRYQRCPAEFGFSRLAEKKEHELSKHLVTGIIVHRFIWGSYRRTKSGRYTRNVRVGGTVRQAWDDFYSEQIKRYPSLLKFEKEMRDKGATCVLNYFKQNRSKDPPLEIEARYWSHILGNVELYSSIDQIRGVDLRTISTIRPELIKYGQLTPGYRDEVIVDLKTSKYSSKKKEWFGYPWPDLPDLQALLYVWLYHERKGKMPVGFYFYYLLDSKFRFVEVDKTHFRALEMLVKGAVTSLNTKMFDKKPTAIKCRNCAFRGPCQVEGKVPEPTRKFENQIGFDF